MKRRIWLALCGPLIVLGATGCSNQAIADWVAWWQEDPTAAEQFAQQPEIQQALANRNSRSSSGSSGNGGGGTVWDRVAQCESGGNWHIATGNGYFGGLQFTPGSWRAAGGSGMPHQASREEQIRVAENLLDMQGWGAWPACSRKLGLR